MSGAVSATCRIVVSYDWSSTRYFLPDHLNSTNVLTDASGTLIEALDYYPYGSTRISQTTGGFNEQKQYVGQYQDAETNLNYLQNRYYNSANGQFLSEDPSFLAIGTPKLTEIWNRVNADKDQVFGSGRKLNDQQALQQFLSDPQLMNSYGYGRDNPIINKDPTGEVIPLAAILLVYGAAQLGVDSWDAYNMNIKYADVTTPEQKNQSAFKAGFDLFTGAVGYVGATAKIGRAGLSLALSSFQAIGDTLDYFYGPQIYQNMNARQAMTQTSSQGRQQFAQNYNASFGLSTGGGGKAPNSNSLWVTPSGAIVTFGGQLFAPPPSKQK